MPDEIPNEPPQVCEVRDWPVFVDGWHKGQLYPDEDMERMEQNFQMLSSDNAEFRKINGDPLVVAVGKLGHDKKQRAADKLAKKFGFSATTDRRQKESWGGLNLGQIKSLKRGGPQGAALIHLVNVPTEIGAKMNAGLINSGSIEVVPELPNPKNPAEKIRGPICTGVAYLGEEQPALKEIGQPKAVFADGTPVPPDYKVNDWLDVFAEVAKESDVEPDRAYAELASKFSAYAGETTVPLETGSSEKAIAAADAAPVTPPQPIPPAGPAPVVAPAIVQQPVVDPQRQAAIEKLRLMGYPVDDPEMAVKSTLELQKMAGETTTASPTASPDGQMAAKKFAAKFAAHFATNFASPAPGSDAFKAMKAKEDPNYPWYEDKDYSAAFAECGMPETEKKNPAFAAFAKGFSAAFAQQFGGDMPPTGAPSGAPAPVAPTTGPSPAAGGTMSYSDCKKFATDPAATPEQKMMAMMATELEEQKRKMGALEAAESGKQLKESQMAASAFSAAAESVFTELECKGRVRPQDRPKLIALYTPTAAQFSQGVDTGSAIKQLREHVLGVPVTTAFSELIDDRGVGDGANRPLSPAQIAVLESDTMRRYGPIGRVKILEEAGVKQ